MAPVDETEQPNRNTAAAQRETAARRRCLNAWTAVAAIVLAAVIIYLLRILSTPVGVIIWTVVIVFCLRGIVNGLEKRGVNRVVGTTIAYVVMVVVLAVLLFLMFSPVFGFGAQFTNLIQSIPGYVQQVIDWGNGIYERYADFFNNDDVRNGINDLLGSLAAWATNFASQGASGAVAFGTGVANSFVAVGFGLVVAFWVLMELPALGRECKRLVGPKHQEDLEMLHVTFTRVMGGYIKATVVQCAIIGVGCGICFAVMGIPNYAALGIITGIMNIIPVVGPWIGGVLAAVVGIFVSPIAALLALIATIAIQQVVYTFISPKLMADSVDVHPALTLVALLAGSAVGAAMSGFAGSILGMLVAIPAVAVAKAVFVYYFEKRTERQLVAPDGVFFKGAPAHEGKVDPLADVVAPHPGTTASFERIADGAQARGKPGKGARARRFGRKNNRK